VVGPGTVKEGDEPRSEDEDDEDAYEDGPPEEVLIPLLAFTFALDLRVEVGGVKRELLRVRGVVRVDRVGGAAREGVVVLVVMLALVLSRGRAWLGVEGVGGAPSVKTLPAGVVVVVVAGVTGATRTGARRVLMLEDDVGVGGA
jgi:hypothetical protein